MKSHKPAARHPADKLCSGRPDLQNRELLPSCHRIDEPCEWGDCPANSSVGNATPCSRTTRKEHRLSLQFHPNPRFPTSRIRCAKRANHHRKLPGFLLRTGDRPTPHRSMRSVCVVVDLCEKLGDSWLLNDSRKGKNCLFSQITESTPVPQVESSRIREFHGMRPCYYRNNLPVGQHTDLI